MSDADEALARLLQEQEDSQARALHTGYYQSDLALARQLQRQEEEEAAERAQAQQQQQQQHMSNDHIAKNSIVIISDDDEDNAQINDSKDAFGHKEQQNSGDIALAWRMHREEASRVAKPKHEHSVAPCAHNEISLQDLVSDPTPDIHALFVAFDQLYFSGKLAAVELQWSKRMTLCAGLCYYKGPGSCLIRLSEPLLKYRPREDMINTLLHEMIHAFLFLLHGPLFADHDGHGPEFLKEAARVNNRAGTNITTYHNFHDEVDHYRQHIWQCNGPCREKPPFFGVVKRSMNRAPQPADLWWQDHQLTCGGQFHKVSEPENVRTKKKSRKITEFFDHGETSGSNKEKRKRTGA